MCDCDDQAREIEDLLDSLQAVCERQMAVEKERDDAVDNLDHARRRIQALSSEVRRLGDELRMRGYDVTTSLDPIMPIMPAVRGPFGIVMGGSAGVVPRVGAIGGVIDSRLGS